MEDADVILHNLFIFEDLPTAFFAVYDGHGGNHCSNYLKEVLHEKLRENILQCPGRLSDVLNSLKNCIISTFSEVDQLFFHQFPNVSRTSGSAAIICLVFGDRILTVNLGDSRAVLCRKGLAIDLSVDHKPTSKEEHERIVNCGGSVMLGRIDSKLAVSRAFGDFEYKGRPQGNLVEIRPDLTQIFMDPGQDEFLIIGCDGLFEAYSSQDLVDIVRKRLAEMPFTEQNPSRVIREIINEAIFEGRTNDNVTALLVTLTSSISL
jgi:protein phosphatase 2C family protein 2/3